MFNICQTFHIAHYCQTSNLDVSETNKMVYNDIHVFT